MRVNSVAHNGCAPLAASLRLEAGRPRHGGASLYFMTKMAARLNVVEVITLKPAVIFRRPHALLIAPISWGACPGCFPHVAFENQLIHMNETGMPAMKKPEATADDEAPARQAKGFGWKKITLLLVVVGLVIGAYLQFGDELSLQQLAQEEAGFRQYQQDHPALVYGLAFLIYVTITGLSLPGATAMTLIIGWLFGWWRGAILVSFASTTGATLAFLFSRYMLRDAIQNQFGERLKKFNRALEREGAFYLFTLRLIPVVPFFVINLVMGLTPVKARTFWWVSQLGMLPGTILYVYAGSAVPSLQTLADQGVGGILSPQLFVAFALLGVFPLVMKKVMAKLRPKT